MTRAEGEGCSRIPYGMLPMKTTLPPFSRGLSILLLSYPHSRCLGVDVELS